MSSSSEPLPWRRDDGGWTPVETADLAPPERPPESLLATATASLARRSDVPPAAVTWSFGRPRSRPHSRLLPLRATVAAAGAAGGSVDAWYKVAFVPRGADGRLDGGWLRQVGDGIERGRRAADAMRRAESPLALPDVLAAEPERLRTISTAVPGRPLGKVLGPRLHPLPLPAPLRRTFHRLGAGVRALEDLEGPRPSLAAARVGPRLEAALEGAVARGTLGGRRAAVEARLATLLGRLEAADGATAWVHGDLSGSNVLVWRHGVGLIDLDWRPRPRGFDVATYSVRLQLESPRLAALTRAALGALLAGYAGCYGAERSAGLLLERAQRWLRLLGEGVVDPASEAGRRVLAELAGEADSLP